MLNGREIMRLRKKRGWSLRELAEAAHSHNGTSVSHMTIKNVEDGSTLDLLSDQVRGIAGALGCKTIDEITFRVASHG